ncbi:MAG: hypothetical protein NC231_09185 [Bacillus sp. (in: Bacteria)]|nr:hypothetical protein [Bacillus sp. (in: firmicutes)]MCM1426887.1 hypothetical protein [Eubacterium sp.]
MREKNFSRKRVFRKNISFVIAVILSVLVVLFCAKETVMSQDRTQNGSKSRYYASMEKEYRAGMKKVLEENGYADSGITVRWVSENGEAREYTVMIHHKRIERLDEEGKEELLRKLAGTEFRDAQCSFQYEFIT